MVIQHIPEMCSESSKKSGGSNLESSARPESSKILDFSRFSRGASFASRDSENFLAGLAGLGKLRAGRELCMRDSTNFAAGLG